MRFIATFLFWLVTTVALAVAVPAAWAQQNVVDVDGYGELAQSAAQRPQLQDAMASELATRLTALTAGSGYEVPKNLMQGATSGYTRSDAFPSQFAIANRLAHRWLFSTTLAQSDSSGRWEIDVSPMLADTSFRQTLQDFGISPPDTLMIPLTENAPDALTPGRLQPLARWGPWVAVGATVLAGVFALLTLATARSRGKALGALGVSALLVGAAGWAALEMARRYISAALDETSGDIRQIADVVVATAQDSAHHWLNLTLAAGAVLVLIGVLGSMLGGARRTRSTPRE